MSSAPWRSRRTHFLAELDRRFEGGFDPGQSLPAGDADLIPPRGSFLVARLEGEPVGCGAVKTLAPAVGSLKRMWVADELPPFNADPYAHHWFEKRLPR